MRIISPINAAKLGLPNFEHHNMFENKAVLDTLFANPGVWYQVDRDDRDGKGDADAKTKLHALLYGANFRSWVHTDSALA